MNSVPDWDEFRACVKKVMNIWILKMPEIPSLYSYEGILFTQNYFTSRS